MINYRAFEEAKRRYFKQDMPFLSEQSRAVLKDKPYQGMKILHNTPLTLEAVLKIEPLLLGGGDVTVSRMSRLPPNSDAVSLLKEANVKLQLDHIFKDKFDFHLDCCAELVDLIPSYGAVELTQTGSEIYRSKSVKYPILSVDDSQLKALETLFGTGDGFTRALSESGIKYFDKNFVVFGYGKVGKGIVHSLLKFTDNIVIIDSDPEAKNTAGKKGLKVFLANEKENIRNCLKNAFCVVTATGVKNLISEYYKLKKCDFNDAILTNMGADDEYGDNFNMHDVLYAKKTFNFSIAEPTTRKYLDPILYAHNFGIDLILSEKIPSGYNKYPDRHARNIMERWAKFYNEDLVFIEEYNV